MAPSKTRPSRKARSGIETSPSTVAITLRLTVPFAVRADSPAGGRNLMAPSCEVSVPPSAPLLASVSDALEFAYAVDGGSFTEFSPVTSVTLRARLLATAKPRSLWQ